MEVKTLLPARAFYLGGVGLCFLGAVCFSTKAVLVKMAYRDTSVEVLPLLALRMLFSLPFFVLTAAFNSSRKDNVRFTGRQWIWIALTGCLGYYISSLLDFIGLQYVSAGMERLILFIYPTLVVLMSAVVLKQRIKAVQWIAILITYVGLVIAFHGEVSLQSEVSPSFVFGAFMIFACAFTYAAYIVGSGTLIPIVGAAKFNSYAMSFACLGVLLHFFISDSARLSGLSGQVYLYGVLMAILSTVIPSYLISEGIKRIGSGNAAIVGSIGPVATIVQAYFFLDESFSFYQGVGTVLIMAGVLVIVRNRQ